MSIHALFPRQSDTCNKPCPPIPECSCPTGTNCFQISRKCNVCPYNQCVPINSGGSKAKQGVSKGALAGVVVGILAALVLAIVLFVRRRKRRLLRMSRQKAPEPPKDIPASAETVLNRPDPTEKSTSEMSSTIRMYSSSENTIDLDPRSQESAGHNSSFHPLGTNPFDDATSIQTAGTEGTNVIPIALVTPDLHRASLSRSEANSSSTSGSQPIRPPRSPDLNLNLDHVNVSQDNVRAPMNYPQSTISGISRNSYLSSASYSSDFLNEAPMIITPTRTNVRQVMGVLKAEVINTGSLPGSPAASENSLRIPHHTKYANKSPLAATSFGPNDLVRETDEEGENDPFSDDNVSTHASPPATARTFGTLDQSHDSRDWTPEGPKLPWSKSDERSRPSSISTQAGSVVDIASATRVNVGLKTPGSANSYRTTMGRLVTPPVNQGPLEEQQNRALAQAQQAQAMERRRISGSSMMSTTTRADSILESFPFVPPSPISDRPIRSPPVSPLVQQSFANNGSSSPNVHQHTFIVAPPSPMSHQSFSAGPTKTSFNPDDSLPAPPDRRTLGLSTGSQLSTASSGLGSFPFQIESEPNSDHAQSARPPSSFKGRQRASLDTLALTSDLSSYPLNFDRDSGVPEVPKSRK